MAKRTFGAVTSAFLGLAPLAPSQGFGFTHEMLPVDSSFTRAVALGDVDGDGDLDAFLGNYDSPSGEQNRLYLNGGTGEFTDVTSMSLPVLLDTTRAVALGDVDGDGDLDAFLGNFFNTENRLYLNSGTGVFADATGTNLPALLDSTTAVALGDVDGDGDLDAYLGRGGQDLLYLNGGTGVFADLTGTNLPALLDSTTAVALGDVDGDGDLDAFVGNGFSPGQQSRLHLNDGTGVFTDSTGTNLPALLAQTSAVELGDLDGDGDLDAYMGNVGQDRLYVNSGTGAFADATGTNLPALLDSTQAVTLGDVDGDGDLDAFVGNSTSNSGEQDRLYLNGGTGVFADLTATNLPALVEQTYAVALGDFDGDGDLDAFVGNVGQDRLYLDGGTGAFTDVTPGNLPILLDRTRAVAFGDVDGDGDLDTFVGNIFEQDRLYLNGGAGAFTDVTGTNLPALSGETRAVALGDVDGDGDLDAYLGRGGQDLLYLNGGTGVFADLTGTNLPALLDSTTAVALGDVDGDGDLDALVGNYDQQSRLYLNGGTGVFTDATATNLPAMSSQTNAVTLGDIDGDGDLDAYLGRDGQDRLYLNSGAGGFADVTGTNLPALLDLTKAVALGDVDGDGDLDGLEGDSSTSSSSGQENLYLNGGTGVFSSGALPSAPLNARAVALGDVDGDGDLDALVGHAATLLGTPGGLVLSLNGGTGNFGFGGDVSPITDDTVALALGDMDGDGDLDAIAGTDNLASGQGAQNRLDVNLTRQVAWLGIPRAGKPLVLDLRGPGNGSWALGASLASASVPLLPFGTLRLDPTSLFVAGGGAFDPQGRATVSFLVPATPAVVGVPVYWQAAVGPPLLLTNLEITTATNL